MKIVTYTGEVHRRILDYPAPTGDPQTYEFVHGQGQLVDDEVAEWIEEVADDFQVNDGDNLTIHDGDDPSQTLRMEAEGWGITVDGRWSDDTVREKIEEARLAAEAEADEEDAAQQADEE